MQRLSVAAAGNADENINLINARFQAEALRRIRGYDCGVLDNSFYSGASPKGISRDKNSDFMWKLTATNVTDIAVGRGMATAYGFDIQSEAIVNFTAVAAPSAGTKYYFIYLEWDLSNPVEAVGKIDIHDNGSSSSWTPSRQDNLITNPIGVYQMPLYRIAVNTAGTVTATANWTVLGVNTIGYALRADNATNAERADVATKAETADTQSTTDKSSKVATTQFVANFVNFGSSTLKLAGVQTTVRRAAKYVLGETVGTIKWDSSTTNKYWTTGCVWGTLPVGYRPSSDYNVIAYMYLENDISTMGQCAAHVLKIKTNGQVVVVTPTAAFGVSATVNLLLRFGHIVP
jgi:hypothetical protein